MKMNKAIGMLAGAAMLLWMAPANAATFFFTNDHCSGTCGGAIPYAFDHTDRYGTRS